MAIHRPSALTQNLSYIIVCFCSICLIAGSALLKLNFGQGATADEKIIEYTYQNESDDPLKRNRFRKVQIKFENVVRWFDATSKDMRVAVYREGELGDDNMKNGKIFALILEDLAKFKSIIFDYNRCISENDRTTEITVYLFKKYAGDMVLAVMIMSIDRQTDKITMVGKELSAEDIWSNDLADPALAKRQIGLDRGFIRIISEERRARKDE